MDDDDEDDEEDEMPLDMEEVENASKKARQEEEIHSEHVQVSGHSEYHKSMAILDLTVTVSSIVFNLIFF